LLVNY